MQHKSLNKYYKQRDVRILAKKIVYHGYFQMLKYQLQHRLFNGKWSEVMDREVFERGKVAGILLYDPVLNSVVLTEQFRIGALNDPLSPWLLEIAAGVMDEKDLDLETLAKRETKEETGLEPLAMLPICQYWTSPGGCTEQVGLFCAKVDASQAGGIFGLAAEHEDIRVTVMNTEQAFARVASGRICNAASIIALQWLQLNQTKVNEQWLVQCQADSG
ncbi:MAG: ADP-ribose diphosphatase [Gammaproteobacteria bacterium]|nr:ADP-ribose diphosphatase [Gammaproteobacteria bacterium]